MTSHNKKRETSQVRVPNDLFAQLKIEAFKKHTTLSKHAEDILRQRKQKKMNIINKSK